MATQIITPTSGQLAQLAQLDRNVALAQQALNVAVEAVLLGHLTAGELANAQVAAVPGGLSVTTLDPAA